MEAEKSWFERLRSHDRRRVDRHSSLPLVAYYWDGAAPQSHPVRDFDLAGMYLLTEQRWYPNTVVTMAVVRTDKLATDPNRSIEIAARVVRSGGDGVGFEFVLPHPTRSHDEEEPESPGFHEADKADVLKFLASLDSDLGCTGHSSVEPKSS